MRLITILTGLICLLTAPALAKPYAEATETVRAKAVESALKSRPDAILVYAKGLCCPSCAIGIRKMLSRLEFVDTTGENKGVELDPKHQLVTLRLIKGAQLDAQRIGKAIDEAGYAPVSLYRMNKGQIISETLTVKNMLWAD